jgi:hypothetical protein
MPPSHPPRPVFAFAAGVIGHRPNRLPPEGAARIQAQMAMLLHALRAACVQARARQEDVFDPCTEQMHLVSALAEGADRIGAEEGLRQHFILTAPLPFRIDEYEKDFPAPEARRDFRRLLAAAHAVLEFDGSRAEEGKAYEQAGLAVLDASDVLIAVWDGKPSAGRGGTTDLVYEAARRGMPVFHIHTAPEIPPRLHWAEPGHHSAAAYFEETFAGDLESGIITIVERLVRPPRAENEKMAMHDYFAKTFMRLNVSVQFPLLMGLMGVRKPRLADLWRPELEAARRQAAAEMAGEGLAPAYVWADEIAVRFGQVFRGAFIANFLISALATVLAILSPAPPWSIIEILLVALLIFNTMRGQKNHWHHLWFEAREVAERLRAAAPLYAIGARAVLPRGETPAWTGWYVRALLRQAGLHNAVLDAAGLAERTLSLRAFLQGQKDYHILTASRFDALHRRLAIAGKYLFAAALIVPAAFFTVEIFHLAVVTPQMRRWVMIASAGLPAIAAALYGIRVTGDFEGAAGRSARMSEQLEHLLEKLRSGSGLDILRETSHRAAEVMLGDVSNWRLVVESRKLDVPG